jgi:carbamoyltransferase
MTVPVVGPLWSYLMSRQILEYHETIGYRFIPNIRARLLHESGGYLVRANGSGFRCNHEFIREKRLGCRRVLLFGDSFSAGDGVSNEKRYGDLLQTLIPNLQVFNFALPATGTDQQYLAYREFAAGIEHDALLISVLVENVRRVVSRYRVYSDDKGQAVVYAKPYFELENGALELRNVPPARDPILVGQMEEDERDFIDRGGRFQGLRKVVSALGLREITQRLSGYQPLPEYDRADSPAWLLMQAILQEWIRGHSKPVIVMPIPLYQYVEQTANPTAYQQRFRELAAATGAALHDPLPDLLRYPAEQRRRFRFAKDIHPTPEGHAALAASLAPVLESVLAGTEERLPTRP